MAAKNCMKIIIDKIKINKNYYCVIVIDFFNSLFSCVHKYFSVTLFSSHYFLLLQLLLHVHGRQMFLTERRRSLALFLKLFFRADVLDTKYWLGIKS